MESGRDRGCCESNDRKNVSLRKLLRLGRCPECRLWVKSAVLTVRRQLPAPHKQTLSESVGMSQRCQKRNWNVYSINSSASDSKLAETSKQIGCHCEPSCCPRARIHNSRLPHTRQLVALSSTN